MLRITETLESQKTIRLRLDGTISTESIAELAETCARHQDKPQKLILLDLAGVDFMKDDAARKLADLQGDSIRIINCSPFIATLLETLKGLD
jgi:anti-anti-sigma regulatory factor